MTKSELIEALAKKQPHPTQKDVDLAVDSIIEQMCQALIANDRIIDCFKMPSFALRKLEVVLASADFLSMHFQLRQRLSMSIMGSSPHRHKL